MSFLPHLTHRVEGDGPQVVLLNGGMMTFATWEPIAARLREQFRVLRFDFRGQLLSPGDPPNSLRGHAEELLLLLDLLDWDAAHLIGASFGALVALELATISPHRVQSLVAITAMDRETPAFAQQAERLRAALGELAAGRSRDRFLDLVLAENYSAAYLAAAATDLAARRATFAALPDSWFTGIDRLVRSLAGFDYATRLDAVQVPALVVAAADDRVMAAERVEALATALGAERLVHPTSGHALVVEDPAWVADACVRFLRSQVSRSASDSSEPARQERR